MYGRFVRVLLREYLAEGVSQTAIAEKLGVSRRTIYRWIHQGDLDRDLDHVEVRYGPRPARKSKLDGYRAIILDRLGHHPKLSAVRLFEEVRAAGYEGGYSQLRDYVRSVRPNTEPEPVERFETPPGLQAQVDFAHFKTEWGRRYALMVVLGYSRFLWVRYYRRQTMAVLMHGLEEAFSAFGGVPKEILFDQMKAVINSDLRDIGGALKENAEFLRFAAHYGFRIRSCRPYRAKTKGKVERPIRYLRDNFFYARSFAGDEDLNAQVERWLETRANIRVHATTGEWPIDQFQREEKAALQPLPIRPYPRIGQIAAAQPRLPVSTSSLAVERRALAEYARLAGRSA